MPAVADSATPRPRMLTDHELPVYTIVAALYREIRSRRGPCEEPFDVLDYPKSKLDIKLVVQRRDRETLSRILELNCRLATK